MTVSIYLATGFPRGVPCACGRSRGDFFEENWEWFLLQMSMNNLYLEFSRGISGEVYHPRLGTPRKISRQIPGEIARGIPG